MTITERVQIGELAPAPLVPTRVEEVVRADDQLRLTVELINLDVDPASNTLVRVPRTKGFAGVRLIFGSQHTVEDTISTADVTPTAAVDHRTAQPVRAEVRHRLQLAARRGAADHRAQARRGLEHHHAGHRAGRRTAGSQSRHRRADPADRAVPAGRRDVPLERLERRCPADRQRARLHDRRAQGRRTERSGCRPAGAGDGRLPGRARQSAPAAVRPDLPDAGPLRRPGRELPAALGDRGQGRRSAAGGLRPARTDRGTGRGPPLAPTHAGRGRHPVRDRAPQRLRHRRF